MVNTDCEQEDVALVVHVGDEKRGEETKDDLKDEEVMDVVRTPLESRSVSDETSLADCVMNRTGPTPPWKSNATSAGRVEKSCRGLLWG